MFADCFAFQVDFIGGDANVAARIFGGSIKESSYQRIFIDTSFKLQYGPKTDGKEIHQQ